MKRSASPHKEVPAPRSEEVDQPLSVGAHSTTISARSEFLRDLWGWSVVVVGLLCGGGVVWQTRSQQIQATDLLLFLLYIAVNAVVHWRVSRETTVKPGSSWSISFGLFIAALLTIATPLAVIVPIFGMTIAYAGTRSFLRVAYSGVQQTMLVSLVAGVLLLVAGQPTHLLVAPVSTWHVLLVVILVIGMCFVDALCGTMIISFAQERTIRSAAKLAIATTPADILDVLIGVAAATLWHVNPLLFGIAPAFYGPSFLMARAIQKEQRARYDADTDPLTRLTSRRAYERDAETLIRSSDDKGGLALIMVDLDHFKEVNDTYGHAAGDAVLQRVAEILWETIRVGDVAARLGGDEFVVILKQATESDVEVIASRINAAINSTSAFYDGAAVSIGGSVGAATYREGDTLASLQTRADQAVYAVKSLRGQEQRIG